MSDLIERLRSLGSQDSVFGIAAAELERLTAENAALKDHNGTIVKLGAENDRLRKENAALRAELQTALGKIWVLETEIADAKSAPDGVLISAASDGWSDPVGKVMREHIDSARAKEPT